MTNSLDRFLKNPEEPSQKEKETLTMSLAQYVMIEGDPRNPAYRREATLQAARGLRALLPERDFQVFMLTANITRGPEEKITPEKMDVLAARPPEVQREPDQPVLAGP